MEEKTKQKRRCISDRILSNTFISAVFLTILIGATTAPIKSQEIAFKKASEAIQTSFDLRTLLDDLHPTLYLSDGKTKKIGDTPVVVECDAESISLLSEENTDYSNVELIRLNIESSSENPKIDISRLKSFQSLRYILLLYTYDVCGQHNDNCLSEITKSSITGTENESKITVLYSLAIPN